MTKSKLLFISAIVIAGGIVSWTLHHRAAATLREAHRMFQQQADALILLREQHARLSNLISFATNSTARSDTQLRELLRARNEVGLLRHKSREINQLHATNQALLRSLPKSEVPPTAQARWTRDQLADIGYADPESAIISTLWALTTDDPNLSTLTAEEKAELARSGKSRADIAAQRRKIGELLNPASATGIFVAGKKFTSPDDAIIDLYYEGEGKTRKFSMKRVDGQWKMQGLISIIAN